MSVITLEQLLANDSTEPHEFLPHGVPTSYDWQSGPITKPDGHDPGVNNVMNPWGQLYEVVDGNPQPDAKAEIRELNLYLLSRRTRGWTWIPSFKPQWMTGSWYTEDFQGGHIDAGYTREPEGSIVSGAGDGYLFHFYPDASRTSFDRDDIAGIAVTARARLHAPSLDPNLNAPAYVLNVGADYWPWTYTGPATGIGQGRFKTVDPEWKLYTYTTLDLATLERYPLLVASVSQNELR